MNDALKDWLNDAANKLDDFDIHVSILNGYQPNNYSVNLDSNKFLGTICFWSKNKFEFQFIDCNTGEIILLETVCFDMPLQLRAYLDKLIFESLACQYS